MVAFGPPATLAANALPGRAAQPAALTLQATFELQCGRVGQMTAGLPAAMGVRTPIAPGAVLVNGAHPASVRTSGHVVLVTMPPPQGVLCDSIGPARDHSPVHEGSRPRQSEACRLVRRLAEDPHCDGRRQAEDHQVKPGSPKG